MPRRVAWTRARAPWTSSGVVRRVPRATRRRFSAIDGATSGDRRSPCGGRRDPGVRRARPRRRRREGREARVSPGPSRWCVPREAARGLRRLSSAGARSRRRAFARVCR